MNKAAIVLVVVLLVMVAAYWFWSSTNTIESVFSANGVTYSDFLSSTSSFSQDFPDSTIGKISAGLSGRSDSESQAVLVLLDFKKKQNAIYLGFASFEGLSAGDRCVQVESYYDVLNEQVSSAIAEAEQVNSQLASFGVVHRIDINGLNQEYDGMFSLVDFSWDQCLLATEETDLE